MARSVETDQEEAKTSSKEDSSGITEVTVIKQEADETVKEKDNPFPGIDEKKLLRKIDWHIIPILTLLYLLSFIDRANIGNAKIEGLDKSLNLTPAQYNWCLTVFFFTYSLFEIPCNIILKKMKPSIWLPGTMVAWGIVMISMGFVQNYSGLIAARFFLGVAEAGLKPGVIYYLSRWYRRSELQFRVGLFFSAAGAAGAFSGLLAYAISFMHGTRGLEGWRWIFILEGILTVLVALLAFWGVSDYPEKATFLTEEERAFTIERLKYQNVIKENPNGQNKGVEANDDFSWPAIRAAFCDWQVWMGVVLFWSCVAPLYGISLFLPTIINDLGFKKTTAQLMTVPVYIFAATVGIVVAWSADRIKKRTPLIAGSHVAILVGFIMCISTAQPAVVYTGIFLAAAGVYGAHPGNISLISNNLAPNSKRAAGTGIHFAGGNLAGAMAANFYRAKDGPRYILGHALEIGFVALGLVTVSIMAYTYDKINKKRDRQMANGEHIKYTEQELSEQGDRAVTFRYML
ncbi:MFS general substrate transporter [Microthyrium microscopicum]|uniref:MFS general substrate transporter n=1 Tax=Microthyrium microscopicum TaxID=703497 RepID=A0A6A6U7W6_9PEZI|nr:MFS general substrate transporter [Microthyrium microscopicum]